MSPLSPAATLPGVWLYVSQIDGERPSSATAPSIWYAAVAVPQRNPSGNARRSAVAGAVAGSTTVDVCAGCIVASAARSVMRERYARWRPAATSAPPAATPSACLADRRLDGRLELQDHVLDLGRVRRRVDVRVGLGWPARVVLRRVLEPAGAVQQRDHRHLRRHDGRELVDRGLLGVRGRGGRELGERLLRRLVVPATLVTGRGAAGRQV